MYFQEGHQDCSNHRPNLIQLNLRSNHFPPELVERCAHDFKFKYRSTLCKIRTDPLNPASTVQFKDMYTNLFLQEERGTEKQKLDYNDILDLKVNGRVPQADHGSGRGRGWKNYTLC